MLRDIVDHAKTHNLALVVGSDVNAHNTVWNSRICDKLGSDRGERLLEKNLLTENVGNTPNFDNGRKTPLTLGLGTLIFYLTLILLWLFQQHYCYNVTGQSQQSEGSDKSARIKEVHPNYIRSRLRCVHSQLLIQP